MVDFRNLVVSLGIFMVALIGFFGLAGDWNFHYGTTVGNDYNATQADVRSMIGSNLTSFSGSTGTSIESQEGAEQGSDAQDALGFRSLGVLTKIPDLMGVVNSALQDFGASIGIPSEVIDVAIWVFVAVFALTFAFVLVNAVGRIF